MKKTLLAIAIPALFAASAANAATVYEKDGQKLDVYGRVQTNVYDKNSAGEDKSSLVGTGRLGLKGSYAINDAWTGIAKAEWKVAAENSDSTSKATTFKTPKLDDNGDPVKDSSGDVVFEDVTVKDTNNLFKARHIYLGFDGGDKGTIIVGQTDTAYYDVVGLTDYMNEWGSEGNAYTGRQEGQIIYRGAWNGFSASASYQFADSTPDWAIGGDDAVVSVIKAGKKDYGYAGTVGYAFPANFAIVAGVSKDAFTSTTDASWDKNDWALGTSYGVDGEDGLYAAALYNESKIEGPAAEAKAKGTELVAKYRLPSAVTFLAGYNKLKWDAVSGNAGTDQDITDAFLLGTGYEFTSKFIGWAEYKFNQVDEVDDNWTLALQYNF